MSTPFTDERLDLISTRSQGPIQTHGKGVCDGQTCVIHNPSQHHMRLWDLYMDPGKAYLAYRICPHGSRHPDPDSMAYMIRRLTSLGWTRDDASALGVHTCDGCCQVKEQQNNEEESK